MKIFLALAALLSVLAFPPLSRAQRTSVRGGEFRNTTIVDETLNRRGRFELGLNVAGALSFGSSTPDAGESSSQSNLYFTGALVAGYMIHDNIEIRVTAGAQYIGQSAGDNTSIANPGFLGTAQVLYQRDLLLGLAIYAGLGGGGFYGTRTIAAGAGLEQRFTSVGGLGQAMLGLLMMPGPRLLLRGGVRGDFLFGSESPSEGMDPGTSFFTTQILFDVSIGVRFGG